MKNGFTLIEILVSVAIFAIVMVIALGALLTMSTADRKAESLKSVINNLNFALDSMSRTIRTGQAPRCGSTVVGTNCTGGSNYFAFIDVNGSLVEYRLNSFNGISWAFPDTFPCQNGQGCIQRQVTPLVGSIQTWLDITAPEVNIIDFSGKSTPSYLFYVIGAPQGGADWIQPRINITLTGIVPVSPTASSTLHLQTTIEQRFHDEN